MGAHKITDIAEEIQVEKIIMHENYNKPVGLAHDIALLKLKTPATIGSGVGTVCLPNINHPLLAGKRRYITGWGTLSSGGSQPDYLMEASVPIVSQAKCGQAYGSSNIHDSMICAGLDQGGGGGWTLVRGIVGAPWCVSSMESGTLREPRAGGMGVPRRENMASMPRCATLNPGSRVR